MKTISNPSSATPYAHFDLLSVTVANGTVLRAVMGYGDDVAYGGNSYYATLNGVWERGAVTSEAMRGSLNSSSVDLSVIAQSTVNFPGTTVPMSQSFLTGAWDNAAVSIVSGYLCAGAVANVTTLFKGTISEVSPSGRSKAAVKVQDYLYLCNLQIPLRTIQPGDFYSLFSAGNGLVASQWALNNTVASGSSNVSIIPTTAWPTSDGHGNNPQNSPYFAQGRLVFTAGNNAGYSCHIAAQASGAKGTLTLQASPPFPVAAGDAFTAYPGYDATMGTAQSKFANLSRFAGFPFVPPPETAA